MSEEDKGVSVTIQTDVGKEIDRGIADVLRALLLKPAAEISGLLGDAIGLVGDKVRAKRQRNLELAIENTRSMIEARQIDMKDITPPDEVEVFQVLNGMSLSSDESIRALWAGLLASSIDPNNTQRIDRAFITVIEALSPQDAKIVNFLVFSEIEQSSSRSKAMSFYSRMEKLSKDKSTREENKETLDSLKSELMEIQTFHAQRIVSLAKEYDILFGRAGPPGKYDWHLNLARLGLIELADSTWSKIRDLRGGSADLATARSLEIIQEVLEELVKSVPSRSDRVFLIEDGRWHVSLGIRLSPFGRKFAEACGIFDQPRT